MKKILYILFIILSIILPYLVDAFLDWLYKLNVISYCDISSYFSFYASFFGGLITLVGVVITLESESKQKREDDSIKYKPILRIEGINLGEKCLLREINFGMPFSSTNDDPKKEEKYNKFYEQTQPKTPTFRLFLKNVGRGETFNTVLEKAEIKNISWDDDPNLMFCGGSNQYIGEICVNDMLGIDFYLPEYLFITENLNGRKNHEISFEVIVNYSDMFNRMKYQEVIYVSLNVYIIKIENELPYFYKDEFKWAKVKYKFPLIMPMKKIYSSNEKKFVHETDIYLKKSKKKKLQFFQKYAIRQKSN